MSDDHPTPAAGPAMVGDFDLYRTPASSSAPASDLNLAPSDSSELELRLTDETSAGPDGAPRRPGPAEPGLCKRCALSNHDQHRPGLAGICVGCGCSWIPTITDGSAPAQASGLTAPPKPGTPGWNEYARLSNEIGRLAPSLRVSERSALAWALISSDWLRQHEAEAAAKALCDAARDEDGAAAQHAATARVDDVRCDRCNLRYAERQQYGCVEPGRVSHAYDAADLRQAAEGRVEPTYDGDQLRERAARIRREAGLS